MENEYLDDNRDLNGKNDDELAIGWKILSFCVPIAGAIIYFNVGSKYPNKQKQACTMALIGVGVNLVIRILTTVAAG